jgi:hypothetical protein
VYRYISSFLLALAVMLQWSSAHAWTYFRPVEGYRYYPHEIPAAYADTLIRKSLAVSSALGGRSIRAIEPANVGYIYRVSTDDCSLTVKVGYDPVMWGSSSVQGAFYPNAEPLDSPSCD